MNESKCKVCDTDLVWVGSMMDGGAECPTCSSSTKGLTMAASSCLDDYVSVPGVYTRVGNMVTAHVQVDAQKVVDEVSSFLPEAWVKLKARLDAGVNITPHDFKQEYQCDFNGAERRTHEHYARRTGKTTAMLRRALLCGRDCVVLVHSSQMVGYVHNILENLGATLTADRMSVRGPNKTRIDIRYPGKWEMFEYLSGRRGHPVFVDHSVPHELVNQLQGMGCTISR